MAVYVAVVIQYLNEVERDKPWPFLVQFHSNGELIYCYAKWCSDGCFWTWPPEKLPFDYQKISKNLTFKKKISKIFHFSKNVKFLELFWQSNGNFPEGQFWTLVGGFYKCNKSFKQPSFPETPVHKVSRTPLIFLL